MIFRYIFFPNLEKQSIQVIQSNNDIIIYLLYVGGPQGKVT